MLCWPGKNNNNKKKGKSVRRYIPDRVGSCSVCGQRCAGASVHGGGGGGSGRISGRGKEIKMNQRERGEQEYSWQSRSKGWPALQRHVIYLLETCVESVIHDFLLRGRGEDDGKKKGISESSAGEEEAEQRHGRNGNFNLKKKKERGEKRLMSEKSFFFAIVETWTR